MKIYELKDFANHEWFNERNEYIRQLYPHLKDSNIKAIYKIKDKYKVVNKDGRIIDDLTKQEIEKYEYNKCYFTIDGGNNLYELLQNEYNMFSIRAYTDAFALLTIFEKHKLGKISDEELKIYMQYKFKKNSMDVYLINYDNYNKNTFTETGHFIKKSSLSNINFNEYYEKFNKQIARAKKLKLNIDSLIFNNDKLSYTTHGYNLSQMEKALPDIKKGISFIINDKHIYLNNIYDYWCISSINEVIHNFEENQYIYYIFVERNKVLIFNNLEDEKINKLLNTINPISTIY